MTEFCTGISLPSFKTKEEAIEVAKFDLSSHFCNEQDSIKIYKLIGIVTRGKIQFDVENFDEEEKVEVKEEAKGDKSPLATQAPTMNTEQLPVAPVSSASSFGAIKEQPDSGYIHEWLYD